MHIQGWLDLVVLKHSTLINHYTILNLTKLDVLDTFETLKVCTGYKGPDGKEMDSFPADLSYLEQCTPVCKYQIMRIIEKSAVLTVFRP